MRVAINRGAFNVGRTKTTVDSFYLVQTARLASWIGSLESQVIDDGTFSRKSFRGISIGARQRATATR